MAYQAPTTFSKDKRHTLELAHEFLIPGRVEAFQSFGLPLVIDRRDGYYLWDKDGHELMDFHLNGGVFNIGHRHPQALQTLKTSLETLDIGNHHFPSEVRAELAAKLARLAPGDLHYSVLTSSGSEANDVAIKSARRATGRRKVVAVDAAYHGRTGLSGAAGDDTVARYFNSDEPSDFIKVPFDDLDAMAAALVKEDVAAVIMETIPATYGFPVPSDAYLPGVKALCEAHGSLYIADEVQTGLGRTGQLWAVDCWGVKPDIMVIGKGLSGGLYPMSAVIMTREIGSWLSENPWGHVSTFGGAELGCPLASLVLDLCSAPATLAQVNKTAAIFADGLKNIQSRHPYLYEVRQKGLIIGLKFDSPNGGYQMSKALYDLGLWAIFAGFDSSVIQFKPGLFVDEAYCAKALGILEKAISQVENSIDHTAVRSINPEV